MDFTPNIYCYPPGPPNMGFMPIFGLPQAQGQGQPSNMCCSPPNSNSCAPPGGFVRFQPVGGGGGVDSATLMLTGMHQIMSQMSQIMSHQASMMSNQAALLSNFPRMPNQASVGLAPPPPPPPLRHLPTKAPPTVKKMAPQSDFSLNTAPSSKQLPKPTRSKCMEELIRSSRQEATDRRDELDADEGETSFSHQTSELETGRGDDGRWYKRSEKTISEKGGIKKHIIRCSIDGHHTKVSKWIVPKGKNEADCLHHVTYSDNTKEGKANFDDTWMTS